MKLSCEISSKLSKQLFCARHLHKVRLEDVKRVETRDSTFACSPLRYCSLLDSALLFSHRFLSVSLPFSLESGCQSAVPFITCLYIMCIYIYTYVCVCVCCASNEVWKASSRETHIWPCNHSWWTQPPKQPPAGNWLGNHQGSHIHCRIFLHTSRAFWTAMIFGCHFKLFIYYLVFWRLFSRFEIHHWSIRVNGFHNLSSS